MPSHRTNRRAVLPRDRAFWAGATVLVVGQLIAFWAVCSHQVRKAEVRHAEAQVERMALADCLRYVPNATLSGCAARVAPLDQQAVAKAPTVENTAVPVNYVYR